MAAAVFEEIFESWTPLREAPPIEEGIPADKFWIVTVSAAVATPPRYRKIVDVMGTIDGFGVLKSTPGISIEKNCPFCWHHANTDLPFHLPVTKVFRELQVERKLAI
ncbi:hypothetical protein ACRQ5Q_16445 [Bradyrhizobium sp. PMVTL-01]|uniref:hypothetical protein n=1 Tax=Bradyrhizobium sp. PMVTL-01 TaxID=3434999 RepID=UPI003F6F4ECA